MDFIGNLPTIPPVKELWKSVSSWRSYWQKCGHSFAVWTLSHVHIL